MEIVENKISIEELKRMASKMYGNFVKRQKDFRYS